MMKPLLAVFILDRIKVPKVSIEKNNNQLQLIYKKRQSNILHAEICLLLCTQQSSWMQREDEEE